MDSQVENGAKTLIKILMLVGSLDASFGLGTSYSDVRVLSDKKNIDYNNLPETNLKGSAICASVIPSLGLRLFVDGFALSYSVATPWQFQYTKNGDMTIFNHYIRPKHVIRIGIGFKQRQK